MFDFKLRLANRTVAVSAFYESTKQYCKDYLTDSEDVDASVIVLEDDFVTERDKAIKENGENQPLTPEILEITIVLRKTAEALVDFDIFLFHASAIAVGGQAYLFAAKSGTGKSTHTRLWRQVLGDRAMMINDDKPFLEVKDGSITVWGSPWNGKHRMGNNISAPLKAVCILNRGQTNSIVQQSFMCAFPALYSQMYRFADSEKMKKTLRAVDQMLKCAGVYNLHCNMEPEAAIVSYNGMRGNDSEA